MVNKIYVFGNPDNSIDNRPFKYLERLTKDYPDISFKNVSINADVPFDDDDEVFILDTVLGIKECVILTEADLDKLITTSSSSVHDYDLGFQLKYLKKLGKLHKIHILGIPMDFDKDYDSFHSSFKKFVAQDMQGS